MILKSFKSFISLLILLIFFSPVKSEDKIDIWKNNKQNREIPEPKNQNSTELKPTQKYAQLFLSLHQFDLIQNLSYHKFQKEKD